MKCKDCEHFKIVCEPLRAMGDLWELGMAECKKHDLVVDFLNHGKINRLECVEDENESMGRTR